MNEKYSRKELFRVGKPPKRTGEKLQHVAFPLGGIGTGSVALGGWGQLRDWEIMNQPAKGAHLPFTFFTLKLDMGKAEPVIKVLQGPPRGDRIGPGRGAEHKLIFSGVQLPHFRRCSFDGTFPIAQITLQDERVPLEVSLEAFNPFIPLNDKDSSIPVAILTYYLKNTGRRKISGTVAGNLCNPLGKFAATTPSLKTVNEKRTTPGLNGLLMSAEGLAATDPRAGSLVLATPWQETDVWPRWYYPHVLILKEMLTSNRRYSKKGTHDIGTVGAHFELAPGESAAIPFFITWYFPNYEFGFDKTDKVLAPGAPKATWKNYYATQWSDAWDVAGYVAKHAPRLHDETKRFRNALFDSTLPPYVLDAVSSQLSTLKTTTCLRLTDGTFYGYEGVNDNGGSCPGSCTHVWNYAQALPYLFPGLQRSMREAFYKNALREDGMEQFRLPVPLGTKADWNFHPAADGQLGGVMQVYREWRISGDTDWLRKMWPSAKKALEFAWKYWDPNRDGVMEGSQHVTYDDEYHGPNPLANGFYLGALRAAEEMAQVMGEPDKAKEYHQLFVRGSRWMDQHLFNGEYYEQQNNPHAVDLISDLESWKHSSLGGSKVLEEFPWMGMQLNNGCLADQLLGQWYARMLGLGNLLDEAHIRKTVRSIFKYNWISDLADYDILGGSSVFALHDEAGLMMCSSPKGNRLEVQYASDMVWTGIEYAAAALMIYEGFLMEGLCVVKGVRERYTGEWRNPWNELECGHHYSRAMSSYSLLLALSGFQYSAPERRLQFAPKLSEQNFTTFFSVGSGWGTYRQKMARNKWMSSIQIEYGSLELAVLRLDAPKKFKRVLALCGGKAIGVTHKLDKNITTLTFTSPVKLGQGEPLLLTFS